MEPVEISMEKQFHIESSMRSLQEKQWRLTARLISMACRLRAEGVSEAEIESALINLFPR